MQMLATFVYRKQLNAIPQICQRCLLCLKHNRPFQHFQVINESNREEQQRYEDAAASISGVATNTGDLFNVSSSYESRACGPLPMSENEWNSLATCFADVCGSYEFEEPTIVRLERGAFVDFCDECHADYIKTIEQSRCFYPNGAFIYVRLKGDEDEPAQSTSSTTATTTATTTTAATTATASTSTTTTTLPNFAILTTERTLRSSTAPNTRRAAQKNLIQLRVGQTFATRRIQFVSLGIFRCRQLSSSPI